MSDRLQTAPSAPREPKQDGRPPHDPWTGLVSGIGLLAAGVIFWLDHQGRLDAGEYLRWWPLALVAFGLAHLPSGRWVAATVLVSLGLLFFPSMPFLPHLRVGDILGLWPLLISAGGATLVRQSFGPSSKDARTGRSFHAVAVMGGNGASIATESLAGGDAVAVMGGCEVDLRFASLEGEAVIDVLAFWGGIEITVPRGWQVEGRVTELLGGFSDTTVGAPDGAPRLVIRGSAIMGGIEVANPKEGGS